MKTIHNCYLEMSFYKYTYKVHFAEVFLAFLCKETSPPSLFMFVHAAPPTVVVCDLGTRTVRESAYQTMHGHKVFIIVAAGEVV